MRLTFNITVELARTSGKFVSKDEITELLLDELSNANPGSVDVDESEYEVTDWEVEPA